MWYAGLPRWLSGKESTCNTGDMSLIPGLERSLEKEMATHYSILAWEIPRAEKPGELYSLGVRKVRLDWRDYPQQQCDMPVPLAFSTGVEKKARSSCLPVLMEDSLVASRNWIY